MTAETFNRRARRLLVLTWVGPPVFGLSFLIFIKMFTVSEMIVVLTTPTEPLFILISLVLCVWYLMHYLRPVSQALENPSEENISVSLQRVRGFSVRYWALFLLYLVVAPSSVIYSAEYFANFVPKEYDWLRIHLVALMVSIIVGLPIFFRMLDLFGQALQGIRLQKPVVSIRLRVFLIAALVPLLVDTMMVQYYWTRTNYFTVETFIVWGSLQVLAIMGALLFMRSFGQSLSPLESVVEGKRGLTDTHALLARSTDELGVLTSRYQELLGHLHLRRRALEIGNRFLRTGEKGISIGATYEQLVELCREALQLDVAFLLLLDEDKKELVGVAQTGASFDPSGHFQLSLDEQSLAAYVFNENRLTAISDVTTDPRVNQRMVKMFQVKSIIAAPLVVEGSTIGVVMGITQDQVRHFTSRDSDLISLLANEAATAVHHKRLHDSQMRAETNFHEASEFAHVTLQSIGDGVVTTNTSGLIQYMNPVAEQLTGYSLDRAQWRSLSDVLVLIEGDTGKQVQDLVKRCLKNGFSFAIQGQTMLVGRDSNDEFAVDVRVSPLRDARGDIRGVVVVFHDTTELSILTHRLTYQASHDALTGLLNRREFEARLELALESSRNDNIQHALCYMDLNQFKVINDTCGHIAGDELLKQLAVRMRASTREADSIARLGGDEFGLLLEGCHLEQAENVAKNMLEMIRNFRFIWGDKVFDIGMSVGLVPISADSGNLTDVLSAADSACYIAKDYGHNRVHVFEHDDLTLAQYKGEMQRLQEIRRALDENLFRLYEQEIRALSGDDSLRRYSEILLRMKIDGEVVAPSTFLPAAERYHLMPAIDRWVVRNAIALLKDRCETCKTTRISINLSGQSLCDEDFQKFVENEIHESGVAPESLCFEITETTAIANITSAIHLMNGLKKRGCTFALDDFGSGLSSFSYLKNLPVDYIKIDGSLVKDMHTNLIDRAMVRSISQIGHLMGIKTIAEYVVNDDVMMECKALGIDYVQGYHVSRPKRVEQYQEELLNKSSEHV